MVGPKRPACEAPAAAGSPSPQAPGESVRAGAAGTTGRTALLAQAIALGARPRLRISLRETDDPEGDIARARPLFRLLASRPGRDAVVVTIHTLDGARRQVLFRCRVDGDLLTTLPRVLERQERKREVRA